MEGYRFNPPPGWPKPPASWTPPTNWTPDPRWPEPPPGWQLWIPDGDGVTVASSLSAVTESAPAPPAPSPSALPPPAQPVVLLEEVSALRARVALLEGELAEARRTNGVVELHDERVLQEVGIYRYHHPLENAAAYKEHLDELDVRIAGVVTDGRAILANDMFTFNNSLAKGRKMLADFSKLMLRAYNAEAENCVRSLRAGNVVTARSVSRMLSRPLRGSER